MKTYKSELRRISLLSLLLLILLITSVNYSLSRFINRYHNPFSMPAHAIYLKSSQPNYFRAEKILKLDIDRDVTIISTDKSWHEAAIYDSKYYFLSDIRAVGEESIRYFSMEDYQEKRPVSALCIDDEDSILLDHYSIIGQTNDAGYPFIFPIDRFSLLYHEGVREIKNLTAQEILGRDIYYIPSDNSEVNKKFLKYFDSKSYVQEDLLPISKLSILYTGLFSRQDFKSRIFLILSILQWLLYIFVLVYFAQEHKKYFKIHWLSGADSMTFVPYTLRYFVLCHLIMIFPLISLQGLLQDKWIFSGLSLFETCLLCFVHIGFVTIAFTIILGISFWRLNSEKS